MLQTTRCQLRLVRYRDVFCMVSAFAVPHFADGLLEQGPFSLRRALRHIRRIRKAHRMGDMHPFSIYLKDNRCVGRIWLVRRKGIWYLGYWMHPLFQGKGYMKECVPVVMKFARQQGIHPTVQAHIWNTASQRVLESSGFRRASMDGERISYAST